MGKPASKYTHGRVSPSDYACPVITDAIKTANQRAVQAHRECWGEPTFAMRAPGRVNLIGEHTDYNDGFCLPMALPFDTVIAVSASSDSHRVEIHSEGFGSASIRTDMPNHELADWALPIAGVLWLLEAQGIPAGGWRGKVASDIPAGASLSSSAAIEVAVAKVVLHLNGIQWSPLRVAELGQKAETDFVGIPTGIMDQFISAGAIDGHAGLLDCRKLTLTATPLPANVTVAVMDTGTRRRLVDVAYAERRATCERTATELGFDSLRDATMNDLSRLAPDDLVGYQRAAHVITENERTLSAVQAMEGSDASLLGSLMNQSHDSLRDQFEVSSPALDQIVEAARVAPGCLGARMTGGGFAGCAVALVETELVEQFRSHVLANYDHLDLTTDVRHEAEIWFCDPQAGASLDRVPQLESEINETSAREPARSVGQSPVSQ